MLTCRLALGGFLNWIARVALAAILVLGTAVDAARASGEFDDFVAKMDTTAPKYQTPECQDARAKALAYDSDPAGRFLIGAALGVAFGIFALPFAAGIDVKELHKAKIVADNLVLQCGWEAFVPEFRERANSGSAEAQAWMGQAYTQGWGVQKDPVRGVHWYQLSADQGNPEAQVNLGALYFTGQGVEQDKAKAVELFRKAASQNFPAGEANLGLLYMSGDGVPQDYDQAYSYLRSAARHGDPSGQYDLGVLHEQGKGARQSDKLAYQWYALAAIGGYDVAVSKRDAVAARMTAKDREADDFLVQLCLASGYRKCEL